MGSQSDKKRKLLLFVSIRSVYSIRIIILSLLYEFFGSLGDFLELSKKMLNMQSWWELLYLYRWLNLNGEVLCHQSIIDRPVNFDFFKYKEHDTIIISNANPFISRKGIPCSKAYFHTAGILELIKKDNNISAHEIWSLI